MSSNKKKEETFDWLELEKDLAKSKNIPQSGQKNLEKVPNKMDELPKDMQDFLFRAETPTEKFKRKFVDNPMIPIGVGLTATCLSVGLFFFYKGQTRWQQLMMRGRVASQAFTVGALISATIAMAKMRRKERKEKTV